MKLPALLLCALFLLTLGGCHLFAPVFPDGAERPPPAVQPSPLPEQAAPAAEQAPSQPEPERLPEPPPEPEPMPVPLSDLDAAAFVRVTDYLPQIRVELRYATEHNFTGTAVYDFTDAYVRRGTLEKLSQAQEALEKEGYSLLIWDAFRPAAAQFRLWEIYPDPVYVANPERGFSSHSRGNTVDVTLVAPDGGAVEMPTDFDDFSLLADRDYSDVPEAAAANAALLEGIMSDCGFQPYSGEWWHFSDNDSYPVETNFIPD